MNYFITILIFTEVIYPTNGIFNNALKKLKQKSKDAYKKKFGKDKTWHFLGFDLTEYPGTNEKYRQINQEKWETYYDCLLSQNTDLGKDDSVIPEALEAVEFGSIRLDCKLCLSPQETTKLDSVEWYWSGRNGLKLKPVDYEENTLLSPSDRSLQMYNLRKEQSGQYVCGIGKTKAPPYFLTVIENQSENIQEVHLSEAPVGPYPEKSMVLKGYNINVDTEWLPWSSCNKCNQIGRKHRLGYCIVKYEDNLNNYTESNNETEPETAVISQEHYEVLRIFKFGIPCNSYILPHSFKKINYIKKRKNEVMSSFCKASCPEDSIFEIRDKNGNVIERANNSAGIYSLLQGLPSIQPSVARTLQYAEKGKEVVLTCPGNLNSDTPIQWQIGSKKLINELLMSESKGRIYISITDKIHIKDAKISDTNVYSCWQHHDLAGTIRLIVEKRFSLDFNHHIMLLGAVLIFSVILYVFGKAFFQQKKTRNA